jgi:hypothetical protein
MSQSITKTPKSKKKSFSSFSMAEAYKYLGIRQLQEWQIDIKNLEPSEFFQTYLRRLEVFDTRQLEGGKKMLVDAFLTEIIPDFQHLKIWKGAPLETNELKGIADYQVSEDKIYLEKPLLVIITAKKDDFEAGLTECLVQMKACQYHHQDRLVDILGIITNSRMWKFYKLTSTGEVYESTSYGSGNAAQTLGALHYIFQECEKNLAL